MGIGYDNSRFARFEAGLRDRSAFQPPQGITLDALQQDTSLLTDVFKDTIGLLEDMTVKPCGLAHENTWTNGWRLLETCGPYAQHNTLLCAHGSRLPLQGVIDTLQRFELISSTEAAELHEVNKAPLLTQADSAANLVPVILQTDPQERERFREQAIKYGYDVPLEEMDTDNAERMNKRIQMAAGKDVLTVYRTLVSALKEMVTEGLSFAERKMNFRRVFEAGLGAEKSGSVDSGAFDAGIGEPIPERA
ncbi:MAG: hypothetical protein KDD70_08290 [Bdellovibrionales bacterium]|nr:hypothetical protein [Bdellovibrionales bacterium]